MRHLDVKPEYDVVVVGARLAGAATAMLLARGGLDVLVVDRGRYGTDTLSTHALMRGGVVQLKKWGVLERLERSDAPAIRLTTFHYDEEALPFQIKPRDGVDALYAPRRTVLDRLLVDAAREAGAELRYGVRLQGLERAEDGRVAGVHVESDDEGPAQVRSTLVIGADGMKSTVAGLVKPEVTHQRRHAAAAAYGYWKDVGLEGFHWHYVPGIGVGTIPTNDGATNVFVTTTHERYQQDLRQDLPNGFQRLLGDAWKDLASRVAGRAPDENLRAFPGLPGYVRKPYGKGWALVGDAGFFRDPITAHGMTDALRDAGLLAEAYLAGGEAGLADYERRRDAFAVGMLDVSDEIAAFEWDLETVQAMHKRLNRIMARESEALAGTSISQ